MKLIDNSTFNTTYGKTIHGFNLIGGDECDSQDGKRFTSTNPAENRDIVGSFPESTQADVHKALDVAKEAFQSWRDVPAPVRANILGKVGEILEKNKETIAFLMTREMGKTLKESGGSVQEAIDTCQFFQSEGRRLYGMTVPSEMRNKELFTYRRPKGVVGIITPANFPLAVASWKIIPALLCGNTVVWKTPPDAPTVAYIFAKIWQAAGLPAGVLNVVHGDVNPGKWLVEAADQGKVQKISFTGSTKVGRMIGEVCGRNLIIPSLELGGKNPLIVMEDADIDRAVEGALWASYGTAGQRCTSAGNLIVHKKVYGEFKKRFVGAMEKIKIGNPILHRDVLYGPMINARYTQNFLDHYQWGKADGAQLVMGKGRITKDNPYPHFKGDPDSGYYCTPTLWEGVKPPMRLALEEIFGPTVTLIECSDIDDALRIANAPNYGLSSAIYTQNRSYVNEFKKRIEAGMSSINNSTTGAESHVPFGGIKGSGNGTRESGVWVIEAYTYWHAINDDMSGKLQLAQMDTENLAQPSSFSLQGVVP